jgi:hypothetical protein
MRTKVGEAKTILGPKTKELMVSSRTVARSRWYPPWPGKVTHLRFHSTRRDRVPVFDIEKDEPLQASVIINIACLFTTASWNLSCCTAVSRYLEKKNVAIRFDLTIGRFSFVSGCAHPVAPK